MPQTHPQHRNLTAQPLDHLTTDTGAGRPSGAGGDDQVVRLEIDDLISGLRVVTNHRHRNSQHLKRLGQIEGEGVVIVDENEVLHRECPNTHRPSKSDSPGVNGSG